MKVEYFELILEKETDTPYLAGEEILGEIEMNVQEKAKISRLTVKLIGYVHTAWRNKANDVLYESREIIVDEYADLTTELSLHCNENQEINEGKHDLPFKIKIPLDILSSIHREGHGSVKYTCSAILDLPDDGESEIIAEKEVMIYTALNLDAPHFRQVVRSKDQVNIFGCCCRRPKGWISAEMVVSELGILPGEVVKISLIIENTTQKKKSKKHQKAHECALLSLCQQIDFRAENRYSAHIFDEKCLTIAVHSQGTCKASQQKGPETKFINFSVPEGLPPTSTGANGLITISYFFKLDMEHFDIIVPVVIGSVKTLDPVPTDNQNNK